MSDGTPGDGEELQMSDDSLCDNTSMIYLGGSKESFRCEICGANCFRKFKYQDKYKCNSCGTDYLSE